jgi:hypothetical protein
MWRDRNDVFQRTASGKKIPQIELSCHLSRPLTRIVGQIETDDFPHNRKAGLGRCAELLGSLTKGQVRTLLSIAGEWRILEKAGRYAEWLKGSDYDAILYKGIMEALGYPSNKGAFFALGEKMPLESLRQEATGHGNAVSHYAIQSLLMHLSGLFPETMGEDWDEETLEFFRFVRGIWQNSTDRVRCSPLEAEKWDLRVRPLNTPLRRIAGASLWVSRYIGESPFLKMVQIFSELSQTETRFATEYDRFRRELQVRKLMYSKRDIQRRYTGAVRRLCGLFQCQGDKYWSYRYSLGGKKLPRPVSLIGETRIREIVVNVAIPILLLHFRQSAKDYEITLYLFYNFIPKLQENSITRFMRHRLFGKQGKDIPVENAVAQQGLHQLFKDYCSKDRGGCLDCNFQANLNRWMGQMNSRGG